MESGRSRRRRSGLRDFRFLSRPGQAQSARHRDLGRKLSRHFRRIVGFPSGRAADHLGRSRRVVLCRRCLGTRHARIPAAALRRDPDTAMGGARRVFCRGLASGIDLDPGPRVRPYRQARCRFLPRAAAIADAVERSGPFPEPRPPRPQSRQLQLRHSRQYADRRVGSRRLLLPQFQHAADVLPDAVGDTRATLRLSAEVRPDLAGGRHDEQGPGRVGLARRGGLRERARVQRDRPWRFRRAWSSATRSITS